MKKIIIPALALLIACYSCNRGRTTEIRIHDDSNDVHIKYAGRIAFDAAGTRITEMEPKSFLEYRKNGRELLARTTKNGQIYYEIDGEKQVNRLDGRDSALLAGAVKEILKATKRRHY